MCGGSDIVLRIFGLGHYTIIASPRIVAPRNSAPPAIFVLLTGAAPTAAIPPALMEVGSVTETRMHPRAPAHIWRSVRGLPNFWRLLQVRVASQFGDGLFQAGLAGALLFNPDRAADPMAIARAFAVLFLPYSLLGPFAGALMDRWDRRLVLVGASAGRLILIAAIGTILAMRVGDIPLLIGALLANGLARFVGSGLSASLPHVVPREQVVTMNSVATASGAVAAFLGANFMLVPRLVLGAGDDGASVIIFLTVIPVSIALLLALRFGSRVLGPDDTQRAIHGSAVYAVITGWLHGARTVVRYPTVAGTLSGLAAHRMVVGINSLLVLVLVHHMSGPAAGGFGTALMFFAATGVGAFLANVLTPAVVRRWGRYATANGALAAAVLIQTAGAGLWLPVMVVCGFLLGVAGQVVKLCADSAMQIDVDDALRGHVFAVQDALFWVSFIVAVTVAATLIPADGHAPAFVLFGSALYLAGLAVHSIVGRR
jgi:MFS family permease